MYFCIYISGDRDRIALPEKTNIVHAEFTYFYYPDDSPFPRKYKYVVFLL